MNETFEKRFEHIKGYIQILNERVTAAQITKKQEKTRKFLAMAVIVACLALYSILLIKNYGRFIPVFLLWIPAAVAFILSMWLLKVVTLRNVDDFHKGLFRYEVIPLLYPDCQYGMRDRDGIEQEVKEALDADRIISTGGMMGEKFSIYECFCFSEKGTEESEVFSGLVFAAPEKRYEKGLSDAVHEAWMQHPGAVNPSIYEDGKQLLILCDGFSIDNLMDIESEQHPLIKMTKEELQKNYEFITAVQRELRTENTV